MNCPYCGSEVRENEKFCQHCGAALPQNAAVPVQDNAAPVQEFTAAPSAELPKSYKEFLSSPYCKPKTKSKITGSAIFLIVCAALSFIVAMMNDSFPIDGILIAGIALWLMISKSFPAGLTACIVGIFELVLTSISMGRFAGYFPAIAGAAAMTATLDAKRQFKAFLEGLGVQNQQ